MAARIRISHAIRSLTIGLLILAVSACESSDPDDVYSARGELIGIADGGNALVVHHEEIEGFMGPMVMTLRFWSSDDEEAFGNLSLQRGDAIAFELVQSDDMYIRNVEPLQEEAELDLPESNDT